MKKLAILLLFALMSSCATMTMTMPKYYALTGESNLASTFKTSKSKEEVWDKAIEFFSKTGTGIKTIDRSSGFIVAEYLHRNDIIKAKSYLTVETKEGFLLDKDAFFVCSRYESYGKYFTADSVLANWNVFVRQKDGETIVNINVTNLVPKSVLQYYNFECKSTRLFENKLFDYLNQ